MCIPKRLFCALEGRAKSILFFASLLVIPWATKAQTTGNPAIVQAEYYIDTDPGVGSAIPIGLNPSDSIDLTFNASVATLAAGYHELVVRVKDDENLWSIVKTHLFYVNPLLTPIIPPPPPFTLVDAEYFFDTDPGAGNAHPIAFVAGDSTSLIRSISTAGLLPGQHLLGVRFKDLSGHWSHIKTFSIHLFQDSLGWNVPVANFGWSSSPMAGQPVQFTNQSSNLPASRRFQWDIGADGSIEYSSFHAQHTFAQPGIYDVLLRVVNAGTEIDTSGLLGLYRFYNGARTNYHGPLGTLIREGGIATVEGRQGNPNGAFSTVNTANLAYLTAPSSSLNLPSLSVSYWFKGSDAGHVVNLLDAAGNGVVSTSSNRHYVFGQSVQAYGSPQEVADGKWHHLAFTYNPNQSDGFKAYVDGELRYQGGTGSTSLTGLDSLIVGAKGSNQANGAFDDLYLFNRVLSSAEVYSLYNEAVSDVIVQQVEIGPLPPNTISSLMPDTICSGDSIVLTAPAGSQYLWSTGESQQQIVVTTSGTYRCAYTDINGQARSSQSKTIVVHETPTVYAHIAAATNGQANGSIALTVSGGSGQYVLNWTHGASSAILSGLSSGIYEVEVTDGFCPRVYTFQIADSLHNSGNDIVQAEAFFDQDPGVGNGYPLAVPQLNNVDAHLNVPVAGLSVGAHTLHIRTQASNGLWSVISSNLCYVQDTGAMMVHENGPRGTVIAAEYFLDTDPGPGNGSPLPLSSTDSIIDVNTSLLIAQGTPVGTHLLGIRVQDNRGVWSTIYRSDIFVDIIPPPNLPDFRLPIVAAEYYFDQSDPGTGRAQPLAIQVADTMLEQAFAVQINGLSTGNHTVHLRVKDVSGQWSHLKSSAFSVDSSCSPPSANFQWNSAAVGSPTVFSNTSTNTSSLAMYYWDIHADGSIEYTSQNIQHSFSQPGIYPVKLSVVNMDSCYAEVIQQVQVEPIPSAQLIVQGNTTFCSGDTTRLIAPVGTHHIWNTLDTSRSLAITQSGTYWASYRDLLGNPRQTPPLQITVHPSLNISWQVVPETNGMHNGGIRLSIQGGSSYKPHILWSTGDTSSMITNKIAGTYAVSIDDGFCPQTFSISIPATTLNPLEGIIAAEYFFGENDPGPGLAEALTVQPGHYSNSLTQISTAGLAEGVHRLYVRAQQTDGLWSPIFGYRVVVVKDTAQMLAGPDPDIVSAEYFFDQDPGPGSGTAIVGINPTDSLDWVEIASTAGLSVGPHLFGSRIKDSEGNWSVVDIRTIHVDRVPEVAAPSWPLVALEYFIGATDPGVGHGIPIPISTGDSIDIHRALDVSTLAPGSYNVFLRAKDLSGLWNHLTSFQLVIRPANCTMPMANFVSTSSIAGQPTSFINTSSNVLPTASVEWDMNADGITDYVVNNPMHVFGSPGIYEVTLRIDNGNGCVNEKVHLQEVGPLPARQLVLSGPSEFCDCDSLIISAPVGSSYLWNTGDTTASIVAGQSGNYSVVVSDSLGNLIQSQSTQVLVHPQPQISTFVSPSYNGMNNGTASVSAVSGGSGYLYHYVWSTGDSTRSIQGLSPGMYWVAVSDPYCTVYDTVIVQSVIQQPLSGVVMAEYMFGDVDPGPGQAHALEFGYGDDVLRSVSVNTQGLAPGIHNLWIRVKEDSGVWSTWARRPITISDTTILPTLPDADIQQVAYFIDTDNGVMNSNLLISGLQTQYLNASYTLNMPSLSPGLHELAVRVRDNNGNWSTIKTAEINNCVPPASPIAGNDLVACVGSTVQLNSVFSGSEPVYWQGPHGTIYSGTQPSFTATDTSYQGYYLVYAEGAGACKSAFDSVYVSVVRAPENAGNIVLNALAQCVTNDTINLFIQPQNGVVNYQWLLPPGALILAGNNTNSVTIDLSGWNGNSAIIQAVLSNACGQDTSNSFALTRCTNTLPVVATAASYALSADSAFTGGIVVQAGASVLQRVGICISLQSQPDLSDRVIDAPVGLGAFHVYVDNLQAQTQYYVRAFAQNNQGVSYGNELSFITPQVTNGCGVSITSSAFLPGNYRVNLSWNSTGASVYNVWFRIVGDTTWSRVNAQTAFRSLFPMAPGDYEYYISEAGNTNPSCVGNFTVECEDFTYSVNTFQIVDATKGKVNVFGVTGGRRTWDFGLDDGTDTTWLNNGFSRRFLNLDPGTYSIYVKDNFDCYSSQVVTVTIDPIDSSVIPVLTTVQNLGGGSLRPVWTVADPTRIDRYQIRVKDMTSGGLGTLYQTYIAIGGTTTTYTINGLPPARYRIDVRGRVDGAFANGIYSNYRERVVSSNKDDANANEQKEEDQIFLYPNPTNDLLYVQAPEGSELSLFDIHGKRIAIRTSKVAEEVFDLSEIAQGVYILQISSEGVLHRERVVKN